MKYLPLFASLLLAALPLPALAQDETVRIQTESAPKGIIAPEKKDPLDVETPFDWNSLPPEYRTTKEQLEAEAQEIYTDCTQSAYQTRFYSCECVSGAFLQLRERVGPAPERGDLLKKVMESTDPSCADAPQIAATTMENCMRARAVFNETATDNVEYCECLANVTAKQFEKKPMLAPAYIEGVKIYANSICANPATRPAKPAAQTQDPLGVNIPRSQ